MAQEQFLSLLQTALLENDTVDAERLINLPSNQSVIKEHLWEIVPSITVYINSEADIEEDVRLTQCVDLLDLACSKCSSEDIILALHKEISDCDDDVKYGYLLKQLHKALVREEEVRLKYQEFAFGAVKGYLKKLPLPDNLNLENKERFLMDTDRDVYRICDVYTKISEFYSDELIAKFETSRVLVLYLLHLFGTPLVYLDLICLNETKSRGRLLAEKIVVRVAEKCDVFKFLSDRKFESNLGDIDKLSLLNFYYLIIQEDIGGSLVPKIYDSLYLLQNCLGFIAQGFEHEHQFIIEKSLLLVTKLLALNKHRELSHLMLEDPVHQQFCTGISKIIIYCPLKSDRQRALDVFKTYLLSFDTHGRYLIIYNMLQLCTHSGLNGFMTTIYKDMLAEALKSDQLDSHFSGKKFHNMLKMFTNLPKREESDLLELADLIVPTLNLIRYLAIRDRANVTGIWNHVREFTEEYLEPLTKGLRLSRAHYNLKINELEQEAAKGDDCKRKESSKVSVSIGGGNLPEMTSAQQMNVMNTSLTAFDVMGSLLTRVVELVIFKNVKP
ncbi:PREDICTED: glomulin [Nicrophorus vespilloides]|uniref:Glomulin n=1 Tax=Nicrophorus vespilloides TaxID=110193 RepID=A0ABM1M1H8_NICVS|nr:PREDICTED: glomulin [Nicrophorus vespilloides]